MTKEELEKRFKNQRSDKFTIILNDNELHLFKNANHIVDVIKTCEQIGLLFIATILHDKDIVEGANMYKTPHYHVVIQLNKICRIGTMINLLMDCFKCNENQISIDKCNSLPMQTRYLIHLDDFDKTRYFREDIVTNDKEVLERYLDLIIIKDMHSLISCVRSFNYDLEMIMLSISNYDKWRKYIQDLIVDHNRKRW